MLEKTRKLSRKKLAMLPSYFDYIFVHLRQKVCLRPDLSPKFLLTLGPNPIKTWPHLQLWRRPQRSKFLYFFGKNN